MFKKYQWNNEDLHKKYNKYNNITLAIAFVALLCLYLLPGNLKMANIVVILIGAWTMISAMKIQAQDKKLKPISKK